jgi:glycine/D-amino acid oxidase-like deaminating enzyme
MPGNALHERLSQRYSDRIENALQRKASGLRTSAMTDTQTFGAEVNTTTSANLPHQQDVVIIGGGIIGVSAAYFLAKRGLRVTLCEKGRIAGEQSSRNWGFVRQQGRDPAEIPMIKESLRIWRTLAEEIGEDVGYRQHGVVYVAEDEEKLSGYEAWLEHAKQHQLDSRMLSRAELGQYFPNCASSWVGGMTTPSDGRAEPSIAAPAVARAAGKLGATVLSNCAVRGIEKSAGRVSGVITEHGRIGADVVVLAGGAWSSLFCRSLDIALPQLKLRGSVLRTEPGPLVTEGALWTDQVALRRREDGGYNVAHGGVAEFQIVPDSFRYFSKFLSVFRAERRRVKIRLGRRFVEELSTPKRWSLDKPGPFERVRVLDPEPNHAILDEAESNLRRMFPELRDVRVAQRWAGLIDVMPDMIPVIGPVDALPGFFLATGFSGHGFGIGPGAGLAVTEMVSGVTPTLDLSPFRPDRF